MNTLKTHIGRADDNGKSTGKTLCGRKSGFTFGDPITTNQLVRLDCCLTCRDLAAKTLEKKA